MAQIFMIGNAHLDPVWLWQWQEGYHEVKATFRSALDRLREFDDFVFTCACACYYRWVEESDPEMFEEIRARVREGRWAVVGGMWIQPDMNTPCGESLIRQMLYSQRYFREKLGLTVRTGYNVDSFGHNAMVPQLLRACGMENYVWMRPSVLENPEIPEGPMRWISPDGSEVTAYRIENEYTCFHDVSGKIDRHRAFSARVGQPVMCFYGVGNHGGGPTVENIREILAYRQTDENGGDAVFSSPDEYFRSLRTALPEWRGELQHHASGCYSTHSRSKALHRRAENALLRAEAMDALSRALAGDARKGGALNEAWRDLLFNEFHDIMGGCSIREALEDASLQLGSAISAASKAENFAVQRVSWRINTEKPDFLPEKMADCAPIVAFNPHEFEITETVRAHRPLSAAYDPNGNPIPVQTVRASRTNHASKWDAVFRAVIPPLGYRLFWTAAGEPGAAESDVSAEGLHMENRFLSVDFDGTTGGIARLVRRDSGRGFLTAPTRAVTVDIAHCDTWAHKQFVFDKINGQFGSPEFAVTENGPVRATVRVTTRLDDSVLRQEYTLYADADQLEVSVYADLRFRHRMVKLCFPTAGTRVFSEIPYGALERKCVGEEDHCQRWIAAQNDQCGLSILNDAKYSYSANGGEMRLTVSNSSIFADHYGQEYRDSDCRFMDQGEQEFRYILCPYDGGWEQAGLSRRAAVLNRGAVVVEETFHRGALGGEYSGISVRPDHIGMGALKRAEDDTGFVLRLSETVGAPASARVDIPLFGRALRADFRPFEIKTFFLPDAPGEAPREMPAAELADE